MILAFMLMISSVNIPVIADGETADHVVISQVYGGGGNSGALYKNDFIELYNPTGSAVDLSGWSVQYASSTGDFSSSNTTELSGTIAPGGYFLIQEKAGSGGTEDLPTPDTTGSINISGTKGKVALVSNTMAIGSKDDVDLVDFVGFGSANEYEGSGLTPAPSNTTSVIRITEGVDTDDNAADFEKASPNPRNSSAGVETKCATPTANIADGAVLSGTEVTFSSVTQEADIEYNTTAVDYVNWTTSSVVTVTEDTTYYVRAIKDGLETSEVATFSYTVNDEALMTIAEAKAAVEGTENLKVEGIVTYISGKNVYIQDDTGAICLYLTDYASSLLVGDAVTAVGTRDAYYNLIELSDVDESTILVSSHDNPVPDLGTATIAELIETPEGKTPGYDHMCEIIDVSGATLTSTSLLTQGDSDIKIYPSLDLFDFPGVSEGDVVNATLRMYDYRGTLEVDIVEVEKVGAENALFLTVSSDSGSVLDGTEVSLNCNDDSAAIYYTLDGTTPDASSAVYTLEEVIIISGNANETVTLKAIAMADGKDDSDILTRDYTIIDENAPLTIKEVLSLSSGTEAVSVTGQIAYFATTYDNPVIQSVIDGETYALYVYGAAPDGAKVGDWVKLTGTYKIYNGLPELTSVVASEITESEEAMTPLTLTIDELNTNGSDLLGRFVKIENVTLGTYDGSYNTEITDATGAINIYKATEYPAMVEAGEVVDLYAMVSCYNSTIQLSVGTKEANGFNIYDVVNDTKQPLITLADTFIEAKPNQDYTLSVEAEDNKGIESVAISYTIGENTQSNQPMTQNTSTGKYEYTISSSEILATETSITFTITATDVTGLQTVSDQTEIQIDNRPRIVAVTPARNSSTGDDKTPEISVTLENAGVSPSVTLTLEKGDAVIVTDQVMTKTDDATANIYSYIPETLSDGNYTATVTVTREDEQSNMEKWSFTVGTAEYSAYFGQLHAHTAEYSDGSGTLQDGLNYLANIPESDNVDFVSFTDHSNYFDTTSSANPAGALNDKTLMTADSLALWDTYVSTMEDFNEEHAGSLLALSGFEMTWSGGPGHINTFNSDGLVSRNNDSLNSKTNDNGMKEYYETLIQDTDPLANLSQFNHPGTTFGTFSDFAYWSPAYDNKMVAIEVGNGEGAIESGGYFASYNEYTKALDKGWHVAPTNNQDNHKGKWGNSNTARTVIITDNFTDEGLLTGLKNMSVYATEDKNLLIEYRVNDLMMGSTISEVPETPLEFSINIDDEDEDDIISKVEIITNGGRVAESKTFSDNVAMWTFELPSDQGYYYVRVTQADKNIAVTAPVWVGQAPLVGISSLETDTKMPVTDESLTVTTTLFNNEESTVTVKSIQYNEGDEVIATEILNTEIEPTGTLKHAIDYTPTVAGDAVLTVTAIISINGQDKTFTADVELDVRASEDLVYVGIDASHYNEYVDGNYKDSMGNFANMAVDYDVRVVELSTSEALIEATTNPKYQMLVLTPPTRRNGNAFLVGYKSYSDDEIAAIADFAASGKTVIITGWGDYYEGYSEYSDGVAYTLPAEEQMSAQQNKLLKAIGSNLRLSDDEIKDDDKNGGQPQRLYLENYNLDNVFLQGVKPLEQVYSNYGGSTVYLVDGEGMPSTILVSSVTPMVYAFETSYSSDDDGDGTTGIENIVVPKYGETYMVAASETVTHESGTESTVIVAGSAFMSNFEIQATLDSYSTPEYSNYTILENVVKSINPVTISDIAEVQAADEGESFTIRGMATSNASGYDKETAFFDCIYVQDETAGINAFPVSGEIQAGQTVEITGETSSYNGERQIFVDKITVIDETIQDLPTPIHLTTSEASKASQLGSLVSVEGTVVSIESPNGVVESVYIKDASNVKCRIFVDGYITSDKVINNLVVGSKLTATGLSSIDTEGARIRIRDRADINCTAVSNSKDDKDDKDDKKDTKNSDTTEPEDKVESVSGDNNAIVSATVTGKQESPGHKKTVVKEATMNTLIEAAKKTETDGKKSVIEIKMEAAANDNVMEVVIPKESFNKIATTTQSEVKVSTGIGVITFNSDAVKQINTSTGADDIDITIAKVSNETLSANIQKTVGDRSVYDFSVKAGNKSVSSFGSGSAKVSVPYTPKENEEYNAIIVYYMDDVGALQTVQGNYNASTKTVDFTTTHFSMYLIGYNQKEFRDVKKSDWYYDAVSFVSSRDIASGTDSDTFSPDESLTRGQFITMLMRAYGIAPDTNSANNFADAGDTYYTGYLSAAKRLGIAGGVGDNCFDPDAHICRQDCFTMLYKTLEMQGNLPENDEIQNFDDFTDVSAIAQYAKVPMKTFTENGIISGSNGSLNPTDVASRAEMAQLLYNLLKM